MRSARSPLLKRRPSVVADLWIVRPEQPDELDLLATDLAIRRGLRLPEDLFPDREVAELFGREVCGDERAVRTPEVVRASGSILADVDLPVRVGDLVDDGKMQDDAAARIGAAILGG